MKELRKVNVLRNGSVGFERYSRNSSRAVFRADLFSKGLPEATEEFYPDSPMELDQDVLNGKKKIVIDVE